MNTPINDEPAFPMPAHAGPNGELPIPHFGMSLRDWFAGQALASRGLYGANVREREVAEECYRIADAMLAERNRRAQ